MKAIKLTFIFLFLITGQTTAQSVIDIVRASNFYSQAVTTYDRGSYSEALKHLKDAETNLKGNTNRDLEYLKIMTSYNLKDYKTAYDLVKTYFEEGYEGRTQHFRNIETYNEKHTISYNEKLTAIFVELEQKYSLVENTSHDDVIMNIVNRIKKEKKTFEEVVDGYIKKTVEFYNPGWSERLIYKKNYISSENLYIEYYVGTVAYIKIYFNPTTNISKNSYTYIYTFDKKEVESQYKSHTNIYQSIKDIDPIKRKSISENILFTEEETIILEQGDNLKKLKNSLKQKGLL